MERKERCPFCGSDGKMLSPTGLFGGRSINCLSCGAQGPQARTTALAWAIWGKRKPRQRGHTPESLSDQKSMR